jgi:DNA sulfur modification protein DndD
MHLQEIYLKNYKSYVGEHRLELDRSSAGQNVHLIGGLNGAGKTSLFSAVPLTLYGVDSAGLVFPRLPGSDVAVSYKRHLEESFSFGARANGEHEMEVGLSIDHFGLDVRLRRTWWFTEGQLDDEDFVIYEGPKPLRLGALDDSERAAVLREYVERLAPNRVAKFFFFDGEEIKTIAERDPDHAVVDGLNQLLGFQTLQSLDEDLQTLKTAIRRELPGAMETGFAAASSEAERIEAELDSVTSDLGQELARRDRNRSNLVQLEDQLGELLGTSSISSQSDIAAALASKSQELQDINSQVQSIVIEVMPLLLIQELARKAAEQSRRVIDRRRAQDADKKLQQTRSRLLKTFASGLSSGKLSPARQEEIVKLLEDSWSKVVKQSVSGTSPLDFMTEAELEIVCAFSKPPPEMVRQFIALVSRRERVQKDINSLRTVQNTFESGDRAHRLLEEKARAVDDLIECEGEIRRLSAVVETLKRELGNAQAVATRLEEKLVAADDARLQLDVTARLQEVARRFMEELRKKRASALQEKTSEMVQALVHKEELVNSILIDPDTWKIRILDRRGDEVLNPSAGEREVFALALVWGLAQISGQSLPVIIDTPLGRLDQMHRANFIREFLPRAGNQVIVLSTDSEVDDRWYSVLKPHLVQETLIAFDEELQSSQLLGGRYLDVAPPQGGRNV